MTSLDIAALLVPPVGLVLWGPIYRLLGITRMLPIVLMWMGAWNAGFGVHDWVSQGDWLPTVSGVVYFAAGLLWWFWRTPRRKRAQAWLGAKSRALRNAVVRKMRERLQPRPIPIPIPAR